MLATRCDQLEADLLDHGIDLRDLWTGRETVRRVAVIASQLPPGSRVWQADMTDAAWTIDQHQTADLIDATHAVGWLTANRGRERRDQTPLPTPTRRPADVRRDWQTTARLAAKAVSWADTAAHINQLRTQED